MRLNRFVGRLGPFVVAVLILAAVVGIGWTTWHSRSSGPSTPQRPTPTSQSRTPLAATPGPLHLTYRRAWPPMTFEVGPAPPEPPVRLVCGTCQGNLIQWNF